LGGVCGVGELATWGPTIFFRAIAEFYRVYGEIVVAIEKSIWSKIKNDPH